MKPKLWTKNFTLLTLATICGAAGGIAGGFALSFLVYDETGSTLASALLIAISVIPDFLIPLFAAPMMDRRPRKPFLVGGDLISGALYALAGVYLMKFEFTYIGYLFFSLIIHCLMSFDRLAYNAIFPSLIPAGCEDKGYTVSSMIYPVLQVIMMPIAALLFETVGVANILLIQGLLSITAGLVESRIKLVEQHVQSSSRFSFRQWRQDLLDALQYLKEERGIRNIYAYVSVTNGVGNGLSPILIAFFRTAPGYTMAMYSVFSVVEFAGRSIGGLLRYFFKIPEKYRYRFIAGVYTGYELMDASLLWLPYPLMLVNRVLCGFFGINSATMRQTAVQSYIPEQLRARLNAFEEVLFSISYGVFSLIIGALGEVLDPRVCMSVCAVFTFSCCLLTIFRRHKDVRPIYNVKIE